MPSLYTDTEEEDSPALINARARESEAQTRADDMALKREQDERYQAELNQAKAEYDARVKDLRPYMGESAEQLHEQILEPVLEKWSHVPGYAGAVAADVQRMKQEAEAKDAARQMVQWGSLQKEKEALLQGGATSTEAAVQAGLQHLSTASAAAPFKFPGFFYAGKNIPDAQLDTLRYEHDAARAEAQAEWQRKQPAVAKPGVATVPIIGESGEPVSGMFAVPAASGKGFTIHNVPAKQKDASTEYQLDIAKRELTLVQKALDKDEESLPTGKASSYTPEDIDAMKRYRRNQQRMEELQERLRNLLGDVTKPRTFTSTATSRTAGPRKIVRDASGKLVFQ